MEDILKQILSELKELKEGQARLEGRQTKLEEGQADIKTELKEFKREFQEFRKETKEKLHEMDNRTIILLSDIKIANRKLDRHSAKLDIISGTLKEHEIRIEDLEGLKV